jgi:hypothetical protein
VALASLAFGNADNVRLMQAVQALLDARVAILVQ